MTSENPTLKSIRRKLFVLGLLKIPMLGFVWPKLLKLDENQSAVKIKLRRRTKNHLESMYIGALVVGADIAAGIHVFYFAGILKKKVSFVFKGMNCDFIKRAESDVVFECSEGEKLKNMILKSDENHERINNSINIRAVDSKGDEVATFSMIVSVKVIPED